MANPGGSEAAEPGREAGGLQGFGEYDPVTGLWEWYHDPAAEAGRSGVTWARVLAEWGSVEADLHDRYGIDCDRLEGRTWRWLRTRIVGLLTVPPIVAPDGTPIPQTRVGWALNPPTTNRRR